MIDIYEQTRQALRAAHELAYGLAWTLNPERLEAAADMITCGDDCPHAWREHDTNATGCHKSESEEGCPFEHAAELREAARTIRQRVWLLAFTPSLPDAARAVLGMLDALNPDFRNGVTDSTGTIDEGEARAYELIHNLRRALGDV